MNNTKKHKTYLGSEALVRGALEAGASFLTGYPITPSSEIMHIWVKKKLRKKNLKFAQMEDEIAAIHTALGASLAGEKAFTATSGPGFSLMQEGLALGFAMQIPLVVINAQRQGPATGMPSISSQGDVLQTQHGPHGDYLSIVFCPNSIDELYELTIQAFNAAEECLSPVILLTEGYMMNLKEFGNLKNFKTKKIKRTLKPLGKNNIARHFTGLTQNENGVETFESKTYRTWIEQRRNSILKTGKKYSFFHMKESKNKEVLLLSYGITSRIVEEIAEKGDYAHFRPKTLFPINEKVLKKVSKKYKNVIVIEMNEGQYASKVQETILRKVKKIRVIGAEPDKKEILENIKNLMK